MRSSLGMIILLLSASLVHAKLELRDVAASHGQLGPVRESREYVRGDDVYVRFTVAGFQRDEDGRTNAEMNLVVTDKKGKILGKKAIPFQRVIALGGDSFPAEATVAVDENFAPGEYAVTVVFKDLLADESAEFKYEFKCKSAEFTVASVRFYQDAQGRAPAPVGGVVGQSLFIKSRIVGFDKSQGEIDLQIDMEPLDAQGKPLVPKPIRVVFHNENPKEVAQFSSINFSGELALNRAGDFRLRITARDLKKKTTATFETPMRVVAP